MNAPALVCPRHGLNSIPFAVVGKALEHLVKPALKLMLFLHSLLMLQQIVAHK